jgi:ribulose-bisphosphate carboxylase large chain
MCPRTPTLLALFRITPQDGVDPVEAGRSCRRKFDRDLDGCLDRSADGGDQYRAKAYKVDPVPRNVPASISATSPMI